MTLDEVAIKEISDKYGVPTKDVVAAIKIGMEYQQVHQRLVEEKKAKKLTDNIMSSSGAGMEKENE